MLLDLHTDFSGGRSGGLVFPSLEEFSTVCCDPHKRFGVVNKAEADVSLGLSCFFYDPVDTKGVICMRVSMPAQSLSHVQPFVTPSTVAPQAPLSMGFSRQELWSGLPFSTLGDLPNPQIKPMSQTQGSNPALVGEFFTTEPPGKT